MNWQLQSGRMRKQCKVTTEQAFHQVAPLENRRVHTRPVSTEASIVGKNQAEIHSEAICNGIRATSEQPVTTRIIHYFLSGVERPVTFLLDRGVELHSKVLEFRGVVLIATSCWNPKTSDYSELPTIEVITAEL
ncbi:hypothetical protein JTB14_006026 [Gonioctena quinquepunctata]|nr:hypothetical protein JTB14_006026 [Gonioctena quinquepunctata]